MKRLLLVLGAVAVSAPAVAQVRDTSVKLDAVAAMVGNVPITVYDVERRLGDSLVAFARRNAGMPTRPVQLAMVKSALNDLVDEEVLLLKAKDAGVEVSDTEIQGLIDNWMKEISAQYPNQSAYRQALTEAGFGTPEEFRRTRTAEMKRTRTIEAYIGQMRSERKIPAVVVPEAAVVERFNQARAAGQLARKEFRVGWRQIDRKST